MASATPSITPPSTAPGPLPRPPRIAAAKPLRPSITPTSQEVKVIGAIRIPAIAPSAADRLKESMSTCRTLMPTNCAASRLCEVASNALPSSVRPKNHDSSSTIAKVTPSTHRLCGRMVAPAIWMGASPEKGLSAWIFLSHVSVARPRSRIEAPIVMMISVTTEAPRAGSTANFSSRRPSNAATATARTTATGRGRPESTSHTLLMPPIITNSPCAKLMTWLAL